MDTTLFTRISRSSQYSSFSAHGISAIGQGTFDAYTEATSMYVRAWGGRVLRRGVEAWGGRVLHRGVEACTRDVLVHSCIAVRILTAYCCVLALAHGSWPD